MLCHSSKPSLIHILGDHPKTAEAIARKINLILGDTKETLSEKTGRPMEEIYEDEVDAVVIHGDDIDGLQGWQWDQSASLMNLLVAVADFAVSLCQERDRVRAYFTSAQTRDWYVWSNWIARMVPDKSRPTVKHAQALGHIVGVYVFSQKSSGDVCLIVHTGLVMVSTTRPP